MIFSNISTLSKSKGIDIYIYAIENLKKNCIFHIVGKSSNVEKEFEIQIREYVKRKNLSNIKFKGFIFDIKSYLNTVDVVVLTSVIPDSLPTVLIEGLAKGKILLASDVGGVREIVDDSYGNLIIPPNNIKELENAIVKISNYSNEQKEEIKYKNIKRAKRLFSIDKQVEKLSNLYMDIIK